MISPAARLADLPIKSRVPNRHPERDIAAIARACFLLWTRSPRCTRCHWPTGLRNAWLCDWCRKFRDEDSS